MTDEVETTTVNAIKTASDGTVKIAVEKYNELLETVSNQKLSINDLQGQLRRAINEPPVINRTVVNKTAEMLASERRAWGGTFVGLGVSLSFVGAFLYRAGRQQ